MILTLNVCLDFALLRKTEETNSRGKREGKERYNTKGEMQLFLFTEDMIVFIEILMLKIIKV